MSELTTWLLEQIAADEADANRVKAELAAYPPSAYDAAQVPMVDAGDPARVLAECAAKRRIVAYAEQAARDLAKFPIGAPAHATFDGRDSAYQATLRALASVYAGEPGWREEWA